MTADSRVSYGLGQTYQRAETSGTTRNYLSDALGSTLALTSGMATPTVNTEYTYEPYGKPATTGSASMTPLLFTGLAWDSGSGLYDNRYSQLNPSIARFGSEDPIDVRGGWNLYGYAADAPTVLTDPLGLDPGPPLGGEDGVLTAVYACIQGGLAFGAAGFGIGAWTGAGAVLSAGVFAAFGCVAGTQYPVTPPT